MNPERVALASQENNFYEFDNLLDNACNMLQHKQAVYSIRRLGELNAILINMEEELDLLANLIPESS